jgi:hypothetical protein
MTVAYAIAAMAGAGYSAAIVVALVQTIARHSRRRR